jgi:hypothetical protein
VHDIAFFSRDRLRDTVVLDITGLLKGTDSNESPVSTSRPSQHPTQITMPVSTMTAIQSSYETSVVYSNAETPSIAVTFDPVAGIRTKRNVPQPTEVAARKQSKWRPEEDALIIELRGGGMKWDDISKQLPGRSPISCRLHYQNYLERRSEWDEERKNKLARLYER